MLRSIFHSTWRALRLAAVFLSLYPAGGCALFHKETWNIDRLRDERAVDIDHRLDRPQQIVKSPF